MEPPNTYIFEQHISLSIKRDKKYQNHEKKFGTIIFEAVRFKRIAFKGLSSDWNNKLNYNVTIFGNVSFCWEFLPLS